MKKLTAILCLLYPVLSLAQPDPQRREQRAKDSMELFAPTPVGKPLGEKVSKVIGAEGGELISPDHSIELNIPSGALSENTTISLQPSTNLSLDGVGRSYHFEPSGLQFKAPAKLVLHYDSKELNGSSPELLAIVFQDEKGSWFSIGKFKIDTAAKTVSGNISHFSYWALSWAYHLEPQKKRVKVSKKVFIRLYPTPAHGQIRRKGMK